MSNAKNAELLNTLSKTVDHAKRMYLIAELEERGVKAKTIAVQCGLESYEIRHYRRIYQSCVPEVLALLESGKLSFSLIKVIASVPRKTQDKTAREAISKKISVHNLRAKLSENENSKLNTDLEKLANQYSEISGLDIRLKADKNNSKAGFWTIRYEDLDMFETITEKLVGKFKDDF